MTKKNEELRKEFQTRVNTSLQEETAFLFGHMGERFASVIKRIEADFNLFEAWVNWKFLRVPAIRVDALKAMGYTADDYWNFVNYDHYEGQREHLKTQIHQPSIVVNGMPLRHYLTALKEQEEVRAQDKTITAREWVRRVKAREVESIKHLSEAEQAVKYRIYDNLTSDKSSLFAQLGAEQDQLLQLKEKIKLAEKYLEHPEFITRPDVIKKKAEARYVELLKELDRLKEVAA